MKIAHISDVHVKNLKDHWEQRQIFQQVFREVYERAVDLVIITGDLFHTKGSIAPEAYQLVHEFLMGLAACCDVKIILGNHDVIVSNRNRLDSVSPVVEAANNPNIELLIDSGMFHIGEFSFGVFSIVDQENWPLKPFHANNINIALYHGPIAGAKTDTGWAIHGESASLFEHYDFAMLGDIHQANQALDADGRIRYAGSLYQDTFGDEDNKGFLLWDIQSKEQFSVEHVLVANPSPFVTLDLSTNNQLPILSDVPSDARIRLRHWEDLPPKVVHRILDEIQQSCRPRSIVQLKLMHTPDAVIDGPGLLQDGENLRDLAVQERLIADYLHEQGIDDEEQLHKVFSMNAHYHAVAEEQDAAVRNIHWRLNSLKWDNLFNYGSGNSIDFSSLHGVVGIFGKNYSGKSSVVDALLYTLFNTTSKSSAKSVHIVNQNKRIGRGEVGVNIAGVNYWIERTSKKDKHSTKADTSINFTSLDGETGQIISHNEESRYATDAKIQQKIGTADDFLLTAMQDQFGALKFIDTKSVGRKTILARFLDLDIFEAKFEAAKADCKDLKALVRYYDKDNKSIIARIIQVSDELDVLETAIGQHEDKCAKIDNKQGILTEQANQLKQKIANISANVPADLHVISHKLKSSEALCAIYEKEIKMLHQHLRVELNDLTTQSELVQQFQYDELKKQHDEMLCARDALLPLQNKISLCERERATCVKKQGLLKRVPCGPEFAECRFIKDAYAAQANMTSVEQQLSDLRAQEAACVFDKDVLAQLDLMFDEHNMAVGRQLKARDNVDKLQLSIDAASAKLVVVGHETAALQNKAAEAKQHSEQLALLAEDKANYKQLQQQIEKLNTLLARCKIDGMQLYQQQGSLQQELRHLEEKKSTSEKNAAEYAVYDLFLRCMHPHGLPYEITKQRLPVINAEIAKILSNMVTFNVFFEAEGKKLEIFIQHANYQPRPIEMASGAEKAIAAMAIRLALLKVSNLPTSNLIILDEPVTSLDVELIEGFSRVLEVLRAEYQTIVLITHLDVLKDVADHIIEIHKDRNGYAHVNESGQ